MPGLHPLAAERAADGAHPRPLESRLVRGRGGRDARGRAADGVPVAEAAGGAGDSRAPLLADAFVPRLVHRRPGSPDRGRRRRLPGLRDRAAPSGQARRSDGDRPARTRARRSGDARPRGDRLRPCRRPLRRRSLSLGRRRVRARHDRPGGPVLLAPSARAAAPLRSPSCDACASSGRCALSTKACTCSADICG